MHRYEGDTTTCRKCGYIHYLKDELISFCEHCNYDMGLKLTPKQESTLIKSLNSTYKKMRVDDIK